MGRGGCHESAHSPLAGWIASFGDEPLCCRPPHAAVAVDPRLEAGNVEQVTFLRHLPDIAAGVRLGMDVRRRPGD